MAPKQKKPQKKRKQGPPPVRKAKAAPARKAPRTRNSRPPDADRTPRDPGHFGELANPPPLIEAPAVSQPFASAVRATLARLKDSDQLEALYDAWLELRLSWRQVASRFAEEQQRLEEQGALLLGALGAAGSNSSAPALVKVSAASQDFAREATLRVEEARQTLAAQLHDARQTFEQALAEATAAVRARVDHRARTVRPRLSLMVRTLPGDRRVLHARRPGLDEAVTLHAVLTGRIPSRYGFLFDDSTDDMGLGPAMFYAEEGVGPDAVRPRPAALKALLDPLTVVWPTKGALPMWLPVGEGRSLAVRWLERGPVMEAEVEEGDGWRSVLAKVEAEAITGALLALKLEGRLELELVRG